VGRGKPRAVTRKLQGNVLWAKLNGVRTKLLVDTGASQSAVSSSFCRRHDVEIQILREGQPRSLIAADGEVIKVQGFAELFVEFAGDELPYHFLVLDNLIHDALLGIDFLHEYGADINCTQNTLSLYNGAMQLSFLMNLEDVTGAVRLCETITVPPRSEVMIPVQTAACYDNCDCYVEGLRAGPNAVLLVARALITPQHQRAMCRVINPSDKPVKLGRNRNIAKLTTLNSRVVSSALLPDLCSASVAGGTTVGGGDVQDTANLCHGLGHIKTEKPLDPVGTLGLQIGNGNLTVEQSMRVRDLLTKNVDIFATKLSDLPGTSQYYHPIEILPGASPPRCRAYRHSPEAKLEIEKQTVEMQEAGIIRPSCSPYAAPVLLVKKKDGSMRSVIDYRRLNLVIRPMFFPLPILPDIFDALGEEKLPL